MADCSEIGLMLGPFEDGELEPHEMQEVARHLARCQDCEKLLDDYGSIGRALRTIAAKSAPALDGFAQAVEARLQKFTPPWRRRLQDMFDGWGERMRAPLVSTAMAAAAAIVTVFLITPVARVYLNGQPPANSLARVETRAVAEPQQQPRQQLASVQGQAGMSTADNSQAVISRLESDIPSVALWSAPQDGTTVIWLPEQQQ